MLTLQVMMHSGLRIIDIPGKGRGVVCLSPIKKGEILEVSPVIVMSHKEQELLDQTLMHDYIFLWGEDQPQCALALGYVSMYNHSYDSNCEYQMYTDQELIEIFAVKNIAAGTELTINYNGTYNDTAKVWFDAQDD
jgi:hypothetical protein